MPELPLPEEEAARYLLDELSPGERRLFETRLEQSAELRALVGELEEAAVALSKASPQKRAPREVWTRIEQALAEETRTRRPLQRFWAGWWRNGWAAAAACLFGWLLYAWWADRPASPASTPAPVALATNAQPGIASGPQITMPNPAHQAQAENTSTFKLLQSRTQELGTLSWQLLQLTNRIAALSQTLTQQQALLSEASRLKFFQLASPAGPVAASAIPVSTNLQRALVLAMARELGWTPPAAPASTQKPATTDQAPANSVTSTSTNQAGVDFVDLRPANTNTTDQPTSPPRGDPGNVAASDLASSSNAVPGFISGTNAILAFDTSIAPSGSVLTFWNTSFYGHSQSVGSAVLGDNPLVVSVPFSMHALQGGNVTVIGNTTNGAVIFLGQYSTPVTPGP